MENGSHKVMHGVVGLATWKLTGAGSLHCGPFIHMCMVYMQVWPIMPIVPTQCNSILQVAKVVVFELKSVKIFLKMTILKQRWRFGSFS